MAEESNSTDDIIPGRYFKITLVSNPNEEDQPFKSQETKFYDSMIKVTEDMETLAGKFKNDYPEFDIVSRKTTKDSDILLTFDIMKQGAIKSKLTLWMIDHNGHTKH